MLSQFDQALRDGSDVIAAAVRPRPVEAVRARGDRRRRRQAAGSAITVAAIMAAGGAALTQLAPGARVGTPAPASSQHSQRSHRVVRPTVQVVIVPNAVGLAMPTAVSLLSAAGFRVTTEVSVCSNTALPAGTVCNTEPVAGAYVASGATVVIDVAAQRVSTP